MAPELLKDEAQASAWLAANNAHVQYVKGGATVSVDLKIGIEAITVSGNGSTALGAANALRASVCAAMKEVLA